jgi:thiol:disulfide interchange protein/DsbC/DsbD-like thiol-disulfide interchange protein
MKIIFTLFLTALLSYSVMADESVPLKPVDVGMQFVSIGKENLLVINYKNFPEWHTYWQNPGDAGLKIENSFSIKQKDIAMNELEWPIPLKFIENGNQWAYGYIGEYSLFYKLSPSDLKKLQNQEIDFKSKWLVCKNICVPGQIEVKFKIANSKLNLQNSNLMPELPQSTIEERLKSLPKKITPPDYFSIRLLRGNKEKSLQLVYEVKSVVDETFIHGKNLIYPYPQLPFDFGHEKLFKTKSGITGEVQISWDGEYQTPPETLNESGQFRRPYKLKFLLQNPITKETIVIEKTFSSFEKKSLEMIGSEIIDPKISTEKKNAELNSLKTTSDQKPDIADSSFAYYLLMAFIGGLILNVMPCVLPVISLKLFGLIKYQRESKKRILEHNIFYTIGVLTTFIIMASIVVGLKNFGTVVGWGFQLQSPNFIAIMIIILFVFSLNLFGMFEFSTPGGKHIGNINTDKPLIGDFLGGVLATILSTPCSAPFLGTALTFAFTSSTFTIFAIFISIGLGLSSPFILTGIYPSLVSFLPKPGNWMNNLKKFLGLTLILTCIWLVDVFNTLVNGQSHLMKLLVILVLIFVAILIKKKEVWVKRIFFLLAVLLYVNMTNTALIEFKEEETALIRDKQAHGLKWEAWSESKMNEHKESKKFVFIDFTAKWCFTCKVNERLVLETDAFKKLVEDNDLKLLIGDWTKRDEVIGSFLMKNGMVGVPAYFIQTPSGELIKLGETVSIDKIENIIREKLK